MSVSSSRSKYDRNPRMIAHVRGDNVGLMKTLLPGAPFFLYNEGAMKVREGVQEAMLRRLGITQRTGGTLREWFPDRVGVCWR